MRSWRLRRNCALSPAQLFGAGAVLAALQLGVACVFRGLGYAPVAAFAALAVLSLAVALLAHARHAADAETVRIEAGRLVVEQQVGPRCARTELAAPWVQVRRAAGRDALVELAAHGVRVRVGRHLRADARDAFAAELRAALRAVQR